MFIMQTVLPNNNGRIHRYDRLVWRSKNEAHSHTLGDVIVDVMTCDTLPRHEQRELHPHDALPHVLRLRQ